jgi:Ca2+-binding EF-hand superfamily protein
VTIAELEYLHRRFQEVQALRPPLPIVFARVLIVLFHVDDISKLTFEAFLQVFHSWKVLSAPDKLDIIFRVLDITDDGELSLTDIAYFCKDSEVKVGDRVM